MLALGLAFKETLEARHFGEEIVELLDFFLGKFFVLREILVAHLLLGFFKLCSSHLIHVMIVDIFIFSLT